MENDQELNSDLKQILWKLAFISKRRY